MFKTKKTRPEPARQPTELSAAAMSPASRRSACGSCNGGMSEKSSPHGTKGTSAFICREEVIEITVIAELRRKGFSLQKIRRVLRFLQREMGKRLSDVLDSESDLHLVTDGKSIFLEDQQTRIIDILKNAKQPMFLVCVSDQVRRLGEPPRKPARAEVECRDRPPHRTDRLIRNVPGGISVQLLSGCSVKPIY